MKIGGIDPKTLPTEEVLVIPRGDECVVFRARGIRDMDEFEKLCPAPKPTTKLTKEGWVPNVDDKEYLKRMEDYASKQVSYIVIKSIEPTEIEWETVQLTNPNTWNNWQKDLKNNGFSQAECNRVLALAYEANCLDESKLKRARDAFLHGPQPGSTVSSGPSTEQSNTPSGEPVVG